MIFDIFYFLLEKGLVMGGRRLNFQEMSFTLGLVKDLNLYTDKDKTYRFVTSVKNRFQSCIVLSLYCISGLS